MNTLTDKAFAASLLACLLVGLTVLLTGNEAHGTASTTAANDQIPRVTVTAKRLSAMEQRALDQQERQQTACDNTAGQPA